MFGQKKYELHHSVYSITCYKVQSSRKTENLDEKREKARTGRLQAVSDPEQTYIFLENIHIFSKFLSKRRINKLKCNS